MGVEDLLRENTTISRGAHTEVYMEFSYGFGLYVKKRSYEIGEDERKNGNKYQNVFEFLVKDVVYSESMINFKSHCISWSWEIYEECKEFMLCLHACRPH